MLLFNLKYINVELVIVIGTSESSHTDTKNTPSKIPCEICGLLFDTVDIKEEHKKLEHVEQKPPSGVT